MKFNHDKNSNTMDSKHNKRSLDDKELLDDIRLICKEALIQLATLTKKECDKSNTDFDTDYFINTTFIFADLCVLTALVKGELAQDKIIPERALERLTWYTERNQRDELVKQLVDILKIVKETPDDK